MPRDPNPNPEKYCSVIEAARTFRKTYHQVRDMFTTGFIDGELVEGRLWLYRESVALRDMELKADRRKVLGQPEPLSLGE